jgi:hypothetical protein
MKVRVITPKKAGQHEIKFHPGGLHTSTHTPAGEKIPAGKREAALAGHYGPKAAKQALFAKNILKH